MLSSCRSLMMMVMMFSWCGQKSLDRQPSPRWTWWYIDHDEASICYVWIKYVFFQGWTGKLFISRGGARRETPPSPRVGTSIPVFFGKQIIWMIPNKKSNKSRRSTLGQAGYSLVMMMMIIMMVRWWRRWRWCSHMLASRPNFPLMLLRGLEWTHGTRLTHPEKVM